jgi:hypothetical protein
MSRRRIPLAFGAVAVALWGASRRTARLRAMTIAIPLGALLGLAEAFPSGSPNAEGHRFVADLLASCLPAPAPPR